MAHRVVNVGLYTIVFYHRLYAEMGRQIVF